MCPKRFNCRLSAIYSHSNPESYTLSDSGYALNGPELVSLTLAHCAEEYVAIVEFIMPGKPTQNTFIERFNRTYRTEILNFICSESWIKRGKSPSAGWLNITANSLMNPGITWHRKSTGWWLRNRKSQKVRGIKAGILTVSLRSGMGMLQTIAGQQKDIERFDDSLDNYMLKSEWKSYGACMGQKISAKQLKTSEGRDSSCANTFVSSYICITLTQNLKMLPHMMIKHSIHHSSRQSVHRSLLIGNQRSLLRSGRGNLFPGNINK